MTDNVFTEKQDGDTGNSEATASNEGDQPTFDFIGEGKQYADVNTALSSIPHKDSHIARIEQENAEMRDKLAESKKLEDVISAMDSSRQESAQTQENSQDGNTSPQDVTDIVRGVLQEERQVETEQGNIQKASDFMVKTYGDKATEVAQAKAQELGMSMAELKGLATRSPAAYQSLFQAQVGNTTETHSSQGDVNTQSHQTQLSGQAKYDEIRRADRSKFLSSDVQRAQMREAMENPEQYFNN